MKSTGFGIDLILAFFFGILAMIFAILRPPECFNNTPCLSFNAICDLATGTCNTTDTVPRPITFGILTLVFSLLGIIFFLLHCCRKFNVDRKERLKSKKIDKLAEFKKKLISDNGQLQTNQEQSLSHLEQQHTPLRRVYKQPY